MANYNGIAGNDVFVVPAGNVNDVLNFNWSPGTDTWAGGQGNDEYRVDSSDDVIVEGDRALDPLAGWDTALSRATDYTLGNHVEYLTLDNTLVAQVIGGFVVFVRSAMNGTGNAMDNVIRGNDNSNVLSGLDGNDTIYGFAGNDTVNGDNGNDWLFAGTGNDTVNGGFGSDYLYGEDGNDTMNGGDGTDVLVGGLGDDAMAGGWGNDTYYVDQVGDVVTESALLGLGGIDTVYASITETLDANVENLVLTGTSAISGYGNTLANRITGNSAGNVLDGKTGADTMEGMDGTDIYYVDNAADVVIEANGTVGGSDLVFSSVTYTITDADVESLYLTGGTATNATGNASNNFLYGNSAGNTLSGLAGADSIFAYAGNDIVIGGTGADLIHGDDGNDTLYGQDSVVANDWAEDRFVFDTALNGATNVDQIGMAYFTAGMEGTDDQFQLENSVFTALTAAGGGNVGTLANFYEGAGLTGSGAFDFAGVYLNTTDGYIYYNPTGNVAGDSVLFAVVNNLIPGGAASLSAEEFTLV